MIPALTSVKIGHAKPDASIVELARDLSRTTCYESRAFARVVGAELQPNCTYEVFAAEINDDVQGGRAEFEACMRSCGLPSDVVATNLAEWDDAERPIACVHVAVRVL